MRFRLLAPILACALLACTAVAFARKPPPASPPPAPPPPPAHPANLEQAVKQVQHQTQGHILAADTVSRGKSSVYRIKVLTPQGQVRVMQLHSSARPTSAPAHSDSRQGGH